MREREGGGGVWRERGGGGGGRKGERRREGRGGREGGIIVKESRKGRREGRRVGAERREEIKGTRNQTHKERGRGGGRKGGVAESSGLRQKVRGKTMSLHEPVNSSVHEEYGEVTSPPQSTSYSHVCQPLKETLIFSWAVSSSSSYSESAGGREGEGKRQE